MSDNDTTFDCTVSEINDADTGIMHIPAAAQREEGICIDTTVEVTMSGFDDEFVTEVAFQNQQTAGDRISVPARLMRKVGLDAPTEVTASFDVVEDDGESLADNRGAVEEDEGSIMEEMEEEFDSMAEDLTESVEDEKEDEGLGKLFG